MIFLEDCKYRDIRLLEKKEFHFISIKIKVAKIGNKIDKNGDFELCGQEKGRISSPFKIFVPPELHKY